MYRTFFQMVKDYLVVMRMDGTLRKMNPAFSRATGWFLEGLGPPLFFELIHPDDRESAMASLREYLRGRPRCCFVVRVLCEDGHYQWVSWEIAPMPYEGERYLLGVGRDVTQERVRQHQVEKLTRFFQHSTDVMVLGDGQLFLDVNPAATRVLGYTREELTTTPTKCFIHPDEYESTMAGLRSFADKPGVVKPGAVNRYICKDGGIRHIEWQGWFEDTPSGGALFYGVGRDVTDEIAHLARLRQLEQLFEQVPLLLVVGRGERVLQLNPAVEQVLGWTAEEMTARSFSEFLHPEDKHGSDRGLSRLSGCYAAHLEDAEETPAHAGGEYTGRYRHKEGGYRLLSWKGSRDSKSPDSGLYYAVGEDITAARETQGRLLRANRDLNDFASVASHELRSPLRRIVGLCEFLKEDYGHLLEGEGTELLDGVVEETYAMEEVVTSLLAYARVDNSRKPIADLDLEVIAYAARSRVLSGYDGEGVPDVNVRTVLPRRYGDKRQLEILFENLIGNGLKFNRSPAPHVEVSYDRVRELFMIRDNGVGIPQTHLERVFQMFERANSEIPGHGVGLALCRRIVERHGGRIWAESTAGTGTRMVFTLGEMRTDTSTAV